MSQFSKLFDKQKEKTHVNEIEEIERRVIKDLDVIRNITNTIQSFYQPQKKKLQLTVKKEQDGSYQFIE